VGRDSVDGDSGDDIGIFVGGENGGGVDWYDGGTGTDTLVVSLTSAQFADAGIRADLFALQAFIAANANAGTDSGAKQTFSSLGLKVQDWEDLTVLVDGEPVELELDPLFTQNPDGVDFDDVQAGAYQDGTQYDALDGDDVVTLASSQAEAAQAGFDTNETFNAGDGNDTITGRGLDDKIDGDAGDDIIDGGAGDDLIHGDDSTAVGVSETRVASGNAAAWLGAGVTLTALDFDGASATVTYDGDGVGVAGGNPVGNQINHDDDGSSETLIATFDAPATEATITVARMFATENGGEQGAWHAYDADGNLVGQGEFGPEITGGGNVGSFTISGIAPFSEVRFTGREYANGTPPGSNDSSDFYVKSIEYTTVGEAEGGNDIIVGGIGDDTLFGQGGDDVIDGDAPTTIEVRDISGVDGCFDVSGTCEVTLTVDFLESLAGYNNSFGYYLAGDDGLPVSGSVVWANVKTGGNGVGDAVTITLDADDLGGAKKLGFFIIPNGANKNPGLSDGDDVTFAQSGGDWSILQNGSPLLGQGADVLFSDESQNPGGYDHEEDAAPVGNMNWEDIVGGGDGDYNDVSLNVSVKGSYFASGIVYDGAAGSGSGHVHSSGSGSGYAHGSGSGSGYAHGSGSGHGTGRGSGSSSGHGGSGSGSASHAGSGSGGADVSFDDYLDGGAGDDVLDGNLGADFVYGNVGNDIGKFVVGEYGGLDRYDGGLDTDTLKVFVTAEQYADADIQSDLVALQAFIDANSDPLTDSGASMTFAHLDLEVQDWEVLEIYVDGKIVQGGDNPADAIDDTANAGEDGPGVVIDVLNNDSVPDGVSSVTIITPPGQGTASVNPDNTITYDPTGDFENLAEGETATVTFTYEVEDTDGDTDIATVTVTVTGTNDDPQVSVVGTDATGAVTEITDGTAGENTDDLVDTGSIAFTDADLSDAHTVSVTENGAGYVGLLGAVIADASTGDGSGSVDWTFTVNDSLLDSLNLGDTLVQSYDVTVDDGNGGTATQTVTVTMTGTNDAPEISFATGADEGTVVEDDATNTVTGQLNSDDVDTGATESWTVVGGGVGTYGTLTVDGSGQWTYTLDNSNPLLEDLDTGETETETFTVQVEDDNGATDTQTVTVTINGNTDNELVTATDDTASADEDGASVIIDVLANDSAPDGVASVTITAGPSEGTAVVNVDNTITFDPALDFQDLAPGEPRDVTITYELEDTDGDTATATVTVTVTGTNDAPVVQNVVTAADEDGAAVTGSFDGDDVDSDDDGTTLTYSVTTAPAEGSVLNNNDGTFSFDPGADFQDLAPGETRDVTFDYTATDSHGAVSNIGTVTVTVTGTNDAPVVQNVSGLVDDNPIIGAFDGDDVDSDDNPSSLTYTITANPVEGTVFNNNDGTFQFEPGSDFVDLAIGETRDVTFEYTATDSHGAVSNTGIVTLTVIGTNEAPVVQNIVSAAVEDGPAVIDSFDGDDIDSDDDGTTLTYTVTSTPSEGSVTNNNDGTFSFDPGADFQDLAEGDTRDVTFEYTATDSHGAVSNTGVVTVTVTGTNDAPVVQDVSASVDEDGPAVVDTFDGDDADSDDDPSSLNYLLTSTPALGILINNGNGTFSFDPNGAFESLAVGETQDVQFTYTATDSHGAVSNTGTVTVTVNGQNDDPVGADDAFVGVEDIALVGNVLADNGSGADSDGDNGASLSVVETSISTTQGGTVTMSSNGDFTYNPLAQFSGVDTFTYTVSDGEGGTDTATVTIDVAAVADAPSFATSLVSGDLDTALPVNLGVTFPDSDGSELHTIILSDVPDNVTFSNGVKNPDGTWTLTEADLAGLTMNVDSAPIFGPFAELDDLDTLNGGDGSEGFILNGAVVGIASGFDVASAGDVNGDGFADVLTSAILADPNGVTNAGQVYIYFGGNGLPAEQNLGSMTTGQGYTFNGVGADDRTGVAVRSAGDVNNDGFDDIFIGAPRADVNIQDDGRGFIVFGSANNTNFADLDDDDGVTDGIIQLSELLAINGGDGSKGFVVNGSPSNLGSSNDFAGYSLGGGIDFNGDGIDDMVIGSRGNDWRIDANNDGIFQIGEERIDIGATYVIFGKSTGFDAEFNVGDLQDINGFQTSGGLGDGSAGIVLRGINTSDQSGYQIAGVRDMDNDGFDELLIGARQADPNGSNSGQAYLVFGFDSGAAGMPEIELASLNGTNGYTFNGINANDRLGRALDQAGDLNGDGIVDIVIGAYGSDAAGTNSGAAYVVFGGRTNLGDLDDDDGVLDGKIEMSELLAINGGDGSKGFVLIGDEVNDIAGFAVSAAGDLNGDGFEDILVGAPRSSADNKGTAGETYVIFGTANGFAPEIDLSDLQIGIGDVGFVFRGIDIGDFSGWTVNAAGDVNGDGIDDVIIGAYLADPNGGASGETYVVYGKQQLGLEDFTIAVTGVATETSNGDTASNDASFYVDIDGNPNNTIIGSPVGGTINGGVGNDLINGGPGDDVINGGAGNDTINGGTGNDIINGDDGDDIINGGDGDDIIDGGAGTDTMDGGAGVDTLSFASATNGVGVDLIFNPQDSFPTGGAVLPTSRMLSVARSTIHSPAMMAPMLSMAGLEMTS